MREPPPRAEAGRTAGRAAYGAFLEHSPVAVCQYNAPLPDAPKPARAPSLLDELPEVGGQEAYERLKWIAGWCRSGRW